MLICYINYITFTLRNIEFIQIIIQIKLLCYYIIYNYSFSKPLQVNFIVNLLRIDYK